MMVKAKTFSKDFIKNYENNRKDILESMKGLKNVPHRKLQIHIRKENNGGENYGNI